MLKGLLYLCLLISIFTPASCQDLVFIPDIKFRNSLEERGLLTRDSLDLNKVRKKRISVASFANMGIANLYGLQYFEDLYMVNISENDLSDLNYLPKNLVELYGPKNKIRELPATFPNSLRKINLSRNLLKKLDHLPPNIEHIDLSNNEIDEITCAAPLSLERLSLANNFIQNMPCSYGSIAFINFFNNPILENSLCDSFYQGKCISSDQNCSKPGYSYRPGLIKKRNNPTGEIKDSVRILFIRQYAWPPILAEIDTFDYIYDELVDSFKLARIGYQVKKMRNDFEFGEKQDSLVSSQFSASLIDSLVLRIKENVQSFKIKGGGINLAFKTTEIPYAGFNGSSGTCFDCTTYFIGIQIKRKTDHLTLVSFFEGSGVIPQLFYEGMIKLKPALTWINSYILYDKIFDVRHQLRKSIYSVKNLKLFAEKLESLRKI